MNTAFVTGSCGWLGSRLVQALAAGLPDVPSLAEPNPDRRIRCLALPRDDRRLVESVEGRVEIVTGDVTEPSSLGPLFTDGADPKMAEGGTLFHCAGLIHPALFVSDLHRVNVEGTRNVLEAAVAAGIKRIVHVSSNSPLGVNPDGTHLFDGRSPYDPYMQYGATKKQGEEIMRAAHEAGRVEVVIVRPPWFYGPNQPPRQSLFFRMVRDGKVPIVGSGENRRSMGYVDNLCQGLRLSEEVEAAAGRTYWVSDARPYTMNEIVKTIGDVLSEDFEIPVKPNRLRLPFVVGQIAQFVDATIQAVGLYHQKFHVLSEMNKHIAGSIEDARTELGYDPKIELREGMRRSIEWMFAQGMSLDQAG